MKQKQPVLLGEKFFKETAGNKLFIRRNSAATLAHVRTLVDDCRQHTLDLEDDAIYLLERFGEGSLLGRFAEGLATDRFWGRFFVDVGSDCSPPLMKLLYDGFQSPKLQAQFKRLVARGVKYVERIRKANLKLAEALKSKMAQKAKKEKP